MGMIRRGDPYGFPEIDTMERRGLVLHLDSVWRHEFEAQAREKQLENEGKVVYVLPRHAPPEEVQGHFHARGIPEMGDKLHLDGKYTRVWDVWVVMKRKKYRKKKSVKSKSKRKLVKKPKRK